MRSPWVIAFALGALSSCAPSDKPRHEDPSGLEGEYEQPRKDLLGELEIARLYVTKEGMTFEKEPFRQSLVFEEVACSSPTSCTVKSVLCSAKLEKLPDGNLIVDVDMRCEAMGGLWYTPDSSKARAAELAPRAAATGLAAEPAESPSAATPISDDDEFPDATALPSGGCLRGCNDAAMTCTRACKGSSDECLADCNRKGMTCANRCTSL